MNQNDAISPWGGPLSTPEKVSPASLPSAWRGSVIAQEPVGCRWPGMSAQHE